MSSPQKDYYEILGVSKEATPDEIRKSYKKLAIKWHPDKHVEDKKEAEEKFKEIAEAYSVLSDPDKKKEYDTGGIDFDFDAFENFDPFAMFDSFFGKRRGKHGIFDFGFGFDDDDEEDNDFFGKNFGFNEKNFGMGIDMGMDMGMGGIGKGKSVKKMTQIINGKKITKTETTTYENGKKKTVIREETGDGKVKEYLLGDDGQKIDMNLKRLKSEVNDNDNKKDDKEKDKEDNEEENEKHTHKQHKHQRHHGHHNKNKDNEEINMINKKRKLQKK